MRVRVHASGRTASGCEAERGANGERGEGRGGSRGAGRGVGEEGAGLYLISAEVSIEQKVQQAGSVVKPPSFTLTVQLFLAARDRVRVLPKTVLESLNTVQRSKNMVLLEELYLIKPEQRRCVIFS